MVIPTAKCPEWPFGGSASSRRCTSTPICRPPISASRLDRSWRLASKSRSDPKMRGRALPVRPGTELSHAPLRPQPQRSPHSLLGRRPALSRSPPRWLSAPSALRRTGFIAHIFRLLGGVDDGAERRRDRAAEIDVQEWPAGRGPRVRGGRSSQCAATLVRIKREMETVNFA